MADITQRTLFNADERPLPCPNAAAVARIEGLVYAPDILPPVDQQLLLHEIDCRPWTMDLRRRVQHYGYRYDYRLRSVDRSMRLGDLPAWAAALADQLQRQGLLPRPPDQIIVNEYEAGQGITKHIDCEPCFDGTIASVSLGSACLMNFIRRTTGVIVPVLLELGSVVVLTGEARYGWMHCIPARKSDTFEGRTFRRSRRISLTFRKVILQDDRS